MNSHETLVTQLSSSLGEFKRLVMRSREQLLGEHQLTRTQVEIVAALRESKYQTIGEVANFLGVTHSASTQTIETLVKRGLVERSNDDNDRRIVRIGLTTEGQKLAHELYNNHIQRMNRAFSSLSEAELKVMITVLGRLTHQFNETRALKGDKD